MDRRRAVRVVVRGRVQGVFFRVTCARVARDAGAAGWVRNRGDGAVEAVFEGSDEAVAAMLVWCRRGPSRAAVTDVEVIEVAPEGLSGFMIADG
jgi:acylphosphatase